jgi:4-carboxymuconolactone decarboxylase
MLWYLMAGTLAKEGSGCLMARLTEINTERLTAEQREVYERIKNVRGQVRGPFAVWLRNAELARHTLELQDLFASRVKLDRRLVQLMILVAARHASAQFAWFVHEPHARQHGISPEIIEAIRERRTPVFTREDERLVYEITLELNTTMQISEATFRRGLDLFGEQKLVELVSAIGFYAMVAMTLNAFDVQVPDEKKPLP